MIKLPRRPGCLTLNPVYEWYFSDRKKVVEYVKRLEEKLHINEPGKDETCWLCEGTGFVMKDRQTGVMFPKESSTDWTNKDHHEHPCPNCGGGMEGE